MSSCAYLRIIAIPQAGTENDITIKSTNETIYRKQLGNEIIEQPVQPNLSARRNL